ncbi:MAG: hypothetical protein PHP03_02740 [Candidatus Pacebacteria bacterium]|nr:hypothetical protein [Candidatus Paceibacterota bacterium]
MAESLHQSPEQKPVPEGIPTRDMNFIQIELINKYLGENPDTNTIKAWTDKYSASIRKKSEEQEIIKLWKEGKKEEVKKLLEEIVIPPPHN